MQALDLPCNPSLDPPAHDPSAMSEPSSPIHHKKAHVENSSVSNNNNGSASGSVMVRRERPSRACTQRAAARLQAAAEAEAAMAGTERKRKSVKKRERVAARLIKEESEEEADESSGDDEENGEEGGSHSLSRSQCSMTIEALVGELEPSQLPRWNIRSMWQLASIFNFLNVFRPLLNIKMEFSAEEFETALLCPNNTLGDVHMPLLKAIPPITRMALGHGTWITVLCRKLRDWWHWVAEGDLPIVASHGAEVEAYNALDPGVRVVILKALCDIRVEQEDIRNYIDDSIKHGVYLSAFRKERIGGDSHGISYWYEDDPIIGHRLYREIRKVEVKKGKGKNVTPIPHSSYQWETVATNLDEFLSVSEKLFSSKNRKEISVGKKLKNDMLPEIEKVHKRKEKLLKKQHRQALMLDGMLNIDGIAGGRSLRDRKPVTYTFDDYDRSINEALKVTKKRQTSPEAYERRDPRVKLEVSANGRWGGPSQYSRHDSFSAVSSESLENDEFYDDDHKTEALDRSNRRRQRPQRYSVKEFVEAISENDVDFDSDDDIVGEVVYDDEYLRKRKERKKTSSSSEGEGDEEYNWDNENGEEEDEEEEEEEVESLSTSEESGGPRARRPKTLPARTRRGTKLGTVDGFQSGCRRSKRATRTRINYQQYEMSESEPESMKPDKSSNGALDEGYDESDNNDDNGSDNNEEFSSDGQDFEEKNDMQKMDIDRPIEEMNHVEMVDDKKEMGPPEESSSGNREVDGVRERRFLDLNELAPGSGFDDGPGSMRAEDGDEF